MYKKGLGRPSLRLVMTKYKVFLLDTTNYNLKSLNQGWIKLHPSKLDIIIIK